MLQMSTAATVPPCCRHGSTEPSRCRSGPTVRSGSTTATASSSTPCPRSGRLPRDTQARDERAPAVNWGSWLDEYDREARLVPALLAVLPLAFAVIGLGFEDNPLLLSIVGALVGVGVPMVVAKQVADRGRA